MMIMITVILYCTKTNDDDVHYYDDDTYYDDTNDTNKNGNGIDGNN